MEPPPEQDVGDLPAVRKPSKDATWMGPKESAVRQHRQELKTKMKTNKVEEVKAARPKQVSPGPLLPAPSLVPRLELYYSYYHLAVCCGSDKHA